MQFVSSLAGLVAPAPNFTLIDDYPDRLFVPRGMSRTKPRPTRDLIGEYGGRQVYRATIRKAPSVKYSGFEIEFKCRCGHHHWHGWDSCWVDRLTERFTHCVQGCPDHGLKYYVLVSMDELRRWRRECAEHWATRHAR